MSGISTGIGLVSGIDSGALIEQLMQLERRPIAQMEGRIAETARVQTAFAELTTRLNALKGSGGELRKPSTFDQARAASSDETIATATAKPGAAAGTYDLRIARLVSSQQLVSSRGFADQDSTPVGAGRITVELGDARISDDPSLDGLRGGRGVRRGVIEITDRDGGTARVDLTDAVTLGDVLDRVNSATGIDVTLGRSGDAITLTDRSGGGGPLRVRDVSGYAAEDLGLLIDSNTNSVTSGGLGDLVRESSLDGLNDGRGVATGGGDGLRVTLRNRTSFEVNLSGARTVGDVLDRFEAAADGKATLEVKGRRFEVRDLTPAPPFWQGGAGPTTIAGKNGSSAAADLGLASSGTNTTVVGDAVAARPGSVLLKNLNGGDGLAGGVIKVTNRAGQAKNIDLRGAEDAADLVRTINASNAGVEARLNNAQNGIDLVDTSGSVGTLTVSDVNGTFAAAAGLAGSFENGISRGGDLERAWLHGGTKLADLNAGRGVPLGKVTLTDSAGGAATIDFSIGTYQTVGDVLAELNRDHGGLKINARVNDTGDGIVVEDAAGGAGGLKIEDKTGGTAKALRLDGEHAEGAVDGSYELSIDVTDADTLADVRQKLADLDAPLRAEVLDVGGDRPFRLSVGGRESGDAARFVFDARVGEGGDALLSDTMSEAADAAVLYGGTGGGSPILATSRTNQVDGLVPGVTVDLLRAGGGPVRLTVEADLGAAVDEVSGMVESFNALRELLDEATDFNEETNVRGPLLGEPSVSRAERSVYALLGEVYETGNPRYRILADVGVSIADGAKLEFDADKFRAAWADDAGAVSRLFSATDAGFGFKLKEAVERLTDPADGIITRANEILAEKTAEFETRIGVVEDRVANKRTRLAKQFLDMELALSRLQFQQQQLSSIPSFDYSQAAGGSA